MAATLLNETRLWHSGAIERQLAHCGNNAVRRAYACGEYWDERVGMMQHWSDHLDFRTGKRLRVRACHVLFSFESCHSGPIKTREG